MELSQLLMYTITKKKGGAREKFPTGFKTTSYPAAIWAGWELFNGRLDGLVWLPSEAGKKNYPDYDLVFLDALKRQGWKVLLGKLQKVGRVEMLVVAPILKMQINFGRLEST